MLGAGQAHQAWKRWYIHMLHVGKIYGKMMENDGK